MHTMRRLLSLLEDIAGFPPRLFHGTSTARLAEIERHGLLPQISRDNSTRRGIYLTDSYQSAVDFADLAAIRDEDAWRDSHASPSVSLGLIVVEVRTTDLDPAALEPDDYELRDALAGRETYAGQPRHPALATYAAWRDVPWQISLQVVGQVLYTRPIPRAALVVHVLSA